MKPKCKVCERIIACNHRTVLCKSCELQHHFKCAGLSVKDYRDIVSDCNRSWTCNNCLLNVFPEASDASSALTNDSTRASYSQPVPLNTVNDMNNNFGPLPSTNTKGQLKCLLANVRSIRNKLLLDFHAIVYAKEFDIIALTETWLDQSVMDHEIIPHGYSIFRKDRSNRRGVLLACKDNLVVTRRSDLEENQCELLWCEISSPVTGSKTLLGIFYRPPDTNIDYISLLEKSFNRIANSNTYKVFLVGDFNLANYDWVNQRPILFDQLNIKIYELLNDLFLTQMNNQVTRNDKILDLVLTSAPDLITDLSTCDLIHSDHLSVTFTINLNHGSVAPRSKLVFDYKKANFDELKKTLSNIPWNVAMLDNDVDVNLTNWEDLFWSAVNEFVPKKKIKDKLTPPWIDREVKILCRKKDKASKKSLRTKDPKDIESFKLLRRKCKKLVRSKYNEYLYNLSTEVSTNPKKFWSFYSTKTKTRKIPTAVVKDDLCKSLVTNPQEKANLFNDHFNSVFNQMDTEPPPPGMHPIVPQTEEISTITVSVEEVEEVLSNLNASKSPGPDGITTRLLKELAHEIAAPLTCLFNQSLTSGKFPLKWKDGNLTPIHKSGPKEPVINYRGIALLSVLSKVLEKCVHSRIYNHVNLILNHFQHGFRKNRSCVTQLLQYVHQLASTLDNGSQMDSIYLDMAKAFDKVPHQKLLYKLEFCGFRNPLLSWIQDYLTNRRHRVIIDDFHSDWKPVTSGVPQGSLIGPILFLIYINDIGSDLSDLLVPCFLFTPMMQNVVELYHLQKTVTSYKTT